MILDGNSSRKPAIKYPCNWQYKIIGNNVNDIIKAAEDAAEDLEYEFTSSNVSKKGKYFSINLEVLVKSEAERNIVFTKLEKSKDVVMVL